MSYHVPVYIPSAVIIQPLQPLYVKPMILEYNVLCLLQIHIKALMRKGVNQMMKKAKVMTMYIKVMVISM